MAMLHQLLELMLKHFEASKKRAIRPKYEVLFKAWLLSSEINKTDGPPPEFIELLIRYYNKDISQAIRSMPDDGISGYATRLSDAVAQKRAGTIASLQQYEIDAINSIHKAIFIKSGGSDIERRPLYRPGTIAIFDYAYVGI